MERVWPKGVTKIWQRSRYILEIETNPNDSSVTFINGYFWRNSDMPIMGCFDRDLGCWSAFYFKWS